MLKLLKYDTAAPDSAAVSAAAATTVAATAVSGAIVHLRKTNHKMLCNSIDMWVHIAQRSPRRRPCRPPAGWWPVVSLHLPIYTPMMSVGLATSSHWWPAVGDFICRPPIVGRI